MSNKPRIHRATSSHRILIAIAFAIALPLALLIMIHTYKADALLRHLINTFVLHDRYAGSTLNLDLYRVAIEAREIAGIDDDLSGLTYNTETNTLFSVLNGQPLIVELDLEGRLLRKIEVRGVKDMEGITHVEGNRYVIADEYDQRLLLLEINDESNVIDVTKLPQLSLGITANGSNKDFEGVSWDDKNRRLLIAKERNPLSIFEITGFIDGDRQQPSLNVSKITPHKFSNIKLRDFSSITYHDESGHLVLLSDESRMAAEYDFEGRAVGALALWRGFHGLQKNVPQAEGIAIGPDNSIYIVSEPNLFYVFKPAD
ncbi:MAG: hypothetical protein CVU15_06610 [Betaproteobacteria bacterium HGW-Betaproteobacteria-1]|jgi:uncharacterized protein YjiK|nr:MAG: hypothetical protein CVU15_06610 [Betaproteobacteria bacterium HGW-Betaproteobacteria-1]